MMVKMRRKAMKTALSVRAALCAFLAASGVLAILLWREHDQCASYFTQEAMWTPPVLVISSDDWGGANPPESVEDLERLHDVLTSVTDAHGNSLVLTTYVNPAEPDFDAISASDYTSYSWRYCYRNKPEVAQRLRVLHEAGIIDIQFHGREHYNIPLWLSLLQAGCPGFREACLAGRVPWREGPGWDVKADPRLPFLRQSFIDAAGCPPRALPVEDQYDMMVCGLGMLEAEFGTRPIILTPPGYRHDMNTLHAMKHAGLRYIDCVRCAVPQVDGAGNLLESRVRWDYGVGFAEVRALIRNVHFEPQRTEMSNEEYLREAMKMVCRQLLARRPVVISSHRWNYVAAENPNRDRDTALLRDLVARIKHVAPDIVFLSASDLARHLYEGGAHAKRSVRLEDSDLSGVAKTVHGLRCVWLGHTRIRLASLLSVVALLWLCVRMIVRSRSRAIVSKRRGSGFPLRKGPRRRQAEEQRSGRIMQMGTRRKQSERSHRSLVLLYCCP